MGEAPRTSGGWPRSLHPRFPLLLLVAGSLPPAGVETSVKMTVMIMMTVIMPKLLIAGSVPPAGVGINYLR